MNPHNIFPAEVGGALGSDLWNAWQLCDSCPWANVLLCDLSILETILVCCCYSQKDCTDIPFHWSSHFIMKTQGFHGPKDFQWLRHGFYSVHQFVFWHCPWYSFFTQKIFLHSPLCKRFKCFCSTVLVFMQELLFISKTSHQDRIDILMPKDIVLPVSNYGSNKI